MTSAPLRVAVLLDENTNGDATLYESPKTLFRMVADAGAMPYGIPYLPGREEQILEDHDGLISPGGRFEFPKAWYVEGRASPAPSSRRHPSHGEKADRIGKHSPLKQTLRRAAQDPLKSADKTARKSKKIRPSQEPPPATLTQGEFGGSP